MRLVLYYYQFYYHTQYPVSYSFNHICFSLFFPIPLLSFLSSSLISLLPLISLLYPYLSPPPLSLSSTLIYFLLYYYCTITFPSKGVCPVWYFHHTFGVSDSLGVGPFSLCCIIISYYYSVWLVLLWYLNK